MMSSAVDADDPILHMSDIRWWGAFHGIERDRWDGWTASVKYYPCGQRLWVSWPTRGQNGLNAEGRFSRLLSFVVLVCADVHQPHGQSRSEQEGNGG